MNHPRIDDEHVLDRYLARRLSPEDEVLFEEHLFECTACLEAVESGEELRRGLLAVAAEEASRTASPAAVPADPASHPARRSAGSPPGRSPTRFAALAAAALLLALAPVLWWQQGEIDRLRSAGLAGPAGDFQVVSLGVVRDAGEAVEVRPDPSKGPLLLSLDLPAATALRYRVVLYGDDGETLWRGEDLEPSLYDSLWVALPANFLEPGSYRITVEGLDAPTPGAADPGGGETRLRVLAP